MTICLNLASARHAGYQPHRAVASAIADGYLAWVASRLEPQSDGVPPLSPALFRATIQRHVLPHRYWPASCRKGCHDRAFGMCLERKARVRRTTPPPESVVAGWYENASLLDSYSIDLSSSKQYSMRVLATRTVGDPPAWIKPLSMWST